MQAASPVTLSGPTDQAADSRLREFARHLAKLHTVEKSRPPNAGLLKHLIIWEQVLLTANAIFKSAPSNDLPVSRAGEWMLDNFYVVKQTFRQIEEDLPASFLKQLPRLDGTPLQGHPRIFALAWEWLGFSQSQLDLTQAAAFAQDYQQVTPLTIGELWALPSMLRIGILERLVYAAVELTGMDAPKGLSKIPSQFASPSLANETVVANCFLSLRLLSTTNWETFFEQTSRVEQILQNDPAEIYAGMDFDTRNSYRSVVEELARCSAFSEDEVALAAVELARNADDKSFGRKTHVGFYLRDAGRKTLEASIRYRPGLSLRIRRALLANPTVTYLGSITLLSALFVFGLLSYATLSGGSLTQRIIVGILGVGLALEAAIILVNWNVTHRVRPQSLPRMDFSEGVPPGNRTMVVVPSLLESADELSHLLQQLELYHLSNPDPQLTYALLTDFHDAPAQDMPEDEQLLDLARTGIKNLNKKYADATPFYLFHRQRQWNPSEGVWMGWERKRGKLADFNRLLLDLGDPASVALRETAYTTQIGELGILTDIKYVITLDADTSLPQGSANRLIATLAHPLNRAEFSPDGQSVIAGYTVLQPRVAIKPTSANRSPFSKIFAANAGFDLYSFAVSDVYQDLFSEGSYVGKGIYDVAAFERSLAGQVRQNTLLSHDLFEGSYGRAALVTDVLLYEEYPSRYLAYARRQRRWIRGDWQLLPWLFPTVRTESGMAPNRLSIINRWKIFDNLRRSLLPANLVTLFAAGWLFLPGSPLAWTLLVLLPSALPILLQLLRQGTHHPARLTLKRLFSPTRLPFMHWMLSILFLPYEALLALSAIGITIARMFILRKNLLQWTPAASVARSLKLNTPYVTWRTMGWASFLAVLLGITLAVFAPASLWVATPLLIAWLVAPQIAYRISQPVTHIPTPLTETQRRQVLRLARRTWAFFEQFAGPNDHWLPPDHFQASPRGSVAHYTTPTNIGLFLVSTLAAYDLGYIGLLELAVRLRSTFETMDKMEHYRGHLMNWYDSQTLTALPPRYVSTVDSGNLVACLITLRQGCLTMADTPLLDDKQWQGLLVILDILSEVLQALEKNNPHASIESFEVELTSIYKRVSAVQNQPSAWKMTLDWLSGEGWERVSRRLMELLERHPHLQRESLTELQHYLDLMHLHLQSMQRSLDLFAPWFKYLDAPAEIMSQMPAWQDFCNTLPVELPALGRAAEMYERIRASLQHFQVQPGDEAGHAWLQQLDADLSSAHLTIAPLMIGYRDLAEQANIAVTDMDFRFLFSEHRQLFHIGYTPSAERLDPSYYDLLASESRIASLIAIAKGNVPQSHWQHLGRPVTEVNGKQVLLSWSGTMFEYLMPTLFTKNYLGTFLSDSCYAALDAQVSYGQEQKVPWGISESGYYAFDLDQHYQYRAFGVPALGYKRDLPDDLVITPYASLLGLSLQPREVLENMARLKRLNMLGRFGFYEALDYTKTRMSDGQTHAIVQSYMAHHQGMILLAACNFLMGDVMVKRFHADAHIQ
ncbi:MAG: cellobiose phosphorylase, partial [Anaerolineaceae bacterium]